MPSRTPHDRPTRLPDAPHLTVRQVANYLSVSLTELYDWLAYSDLPHFRKGKVIRIPRTEFLVWYQGYRFPQSHTKVSAPLSASAQSDLFSTNK